MAKARKIMITVDESLLADIEDYASRMHLNRSASISVLCSTALQAHKSMATLEDLMQVYKTEKAKAGLAVSSADGTGE